jgi:hypothetical protein
VAAGYSVSMLDTQCPSPCRGLSALLKRSAKALRHVSCDPVVASSAFATRAERPPRDVTGPGTTMRRSVDQPREIDRLVTLVRREQKRRMHTAVYSLWNVGDGVHRLRRTVGPGNWSRSLVGCAARLALHASSLIDAGRAAKAFGRAQRLELCERFEKAAPSSRLRMSSSWRESPCGSGRAASRRCSKTRTQFAILGRTCAGKPCDRPQSSARHERQLDLGAAAVESRKRRRARAQGGGMARESVGFAHAQLFGHRDSASFR